MSIKANQKTYEAKNNPFIITSSLPFDVSFWVSCVVGYLIPEMLEEGYEEG